jgi:hypothetical protein
MASDRVTILVLYFKGKTFGVGAFPGFGGGDAEAQMEE